MFLKVNGVFLDKKMYIIGSLKGCMLKEVESFDEVAYLQEQILRLTGQISDAYNNHQDISELLQRQQECSSQLLAQLYPKKPRPTKVPYLSIIK
jgi:hypothetical protein